jgi:hypothetical protein
LFFSDPMTMRHTTIPHTRGGWSTEAEEAVDVHSETNPMNKGNGQTSKTASAAT